MFATPRKQRTDFDGVTWFMPALAKRSVGSSWGTQGLDFQKVWACLSVKKEMNELRTRDAGQPLSENS